RAGRRRVGAAALAPSRAGVGGRPQRRPPQPVRPAVRDRPVLRAPGGPPPARRAAAPRDRPERADGPGVAHASRELDFFDLKGVVEALVEALRIDSTFAPTSRDLLASGRTAALVAAGGPYGVLGELARATAERYDFPNRVL